MKINDILIKPVLTEKATRLAQGKVYAFEVTRNSNKYQIKDSVEKIFKVKVLKVRVVQRLGKKKKSGKRMIIKTLPTRKIAFISVKEGKISLFPEA